MKITFYNKIDDREEQGDLKYYSNGMFYVDVNYLDNIITTKISQSQLYIDPNCITNNFIVETNLRSNLYQTSKFELAEAYVNGYNEAIDYLTPDNIAKVIFEEPIL